MKRVERIRLYPTSHQKNALQFMLDVTRQLYNALLQQRCDAFRLRGTSLRSKAQYAELTALRRDDSRVAAVYRECEDAALRRLELAFAAFFRRVKQGERPGYPRFKPAARWHQLSFSHGNHALRLDERQSRIRIPGVGLVKLRKGRSIPAFGRAWLVERLGRWYACLECEREASPLPKTGVTLGIDRGVHVLAACSDGRLIRNRAVGERRKAATARLQRELESVTQRDAAGRVRNRRESQRIAAALRLARSREREANARRDFAHKTARAIVNAADVIGLERLHVRAMTRSARGTVEAPGVNVRAKAGLNRVVLDAGFGLLDRLIAEKAEEAARVVVRVAARFSSQTCSRCGYVCARSRRRRRFCCVRCGLEAHADVNAALEIRRRAQLALLRLPDAGEEPANQHNAA
ncbi:MAG TPA: transposase [Candidatus Tumulicola sp.]|jgi:putative transposase